MGGSLGSDKINKCIKCNLEIKLDLTLTVVCGAKMRNYTKKYTENLKMK